MSRALPNAVAAVAVYLALLVSVAVGVPSMTHASGLSGFLTLEANGTAIMHAKLDEAGMTALLQKQIADALSANKVDHTRADVAALVRQAQAQWTKWHKDFVIDGKCSESRVVRATAPSGGFVYVLECRDCRPQTC